MNTRVLSAIDPQAILEAVRLLRQGDLVAFPTDTVYGVAAMPEYPEAVARLYEIKGRDASKAIAILLSSPDEVALVAGDMGDMALRLARRFWPGPLTLVIPKKPSLPAEISSGPTVGVRMPNHPATLALLRQTGPLAVTSGNKSGASSAVSAQDVLDHLGGTIPLILDGGRSPGNLSSTVVDCTGDAPRILREGPISFDEISEMLS